MQQQQQRAPDDGGHDAALSESLSSERSEDTLTTAIDSDPAAWEQPEQKKEAAAAAAAQPRAPARQPQQPPQRSYRTPPAHQVMRYMGASAIQHARGGSLPYSMFGPILPSLERTARASEPARAAAPPRRSDAEIAALLEGVGSFQTELGVFS